MSLIETLEQMDRSLFILINQKLSHSIFDAIFPVFTDLHKHGWFVFLVAPALIGAWFYKKRSEAMGVLLGLIAVVGFADAMNTRLLKPTFQRERPPRAEISIQLRTHRYGGYSMPSNHAANIFAGMTFLSLAYPGIRWVAMILAAAVAYSRVYVGVHFPADVFAGGCLGMLYALAFFRLYSAIRARLVV